MLPTSVTHGPVFTGSAPLTCIQKKSLLDPALNLRTYTLPVVHWFTLLNSQSSGKMIKSCKNMRDTWEGCLAGEPKALWSAALRRFTAWTSTQCNPETDPKPRNLFLSLIRWRSYTFTVNSNHTVESTYHSTYIHSTYSYRKRIRASVIIIKSGLFISFFFCSCILTPNAVQREHQ